MQGWASKWLNYTLDKDINSSYLFQINQCITVAQTLQSEPFFYFDARYVPHFNWRKTGHFEATLGQAET